MHTDSPRVTEIKINNRWWSFPNIAMHPLDGAIEVKVVCGFPGTGKTTVTQQIGWKDSDSSQFSWSSPGVRKPEWPTNYIKHINEVQGPILASTHDAVLRALSDAKVMFSLAYPAKECLDEYIARYEKRGSPQKFIDLIRENWDQWLTELKNNRAWFHIELKPGEYLSDYLRTRTL